MNTNKKINRANNEAKNEAKRRSREIEELRKTRLCKAWRVNSTALSIYGGGCVYVFRDVSKIITGLNAKT